MCRFALFLFAFLSSTATAASAPARERHVLAKTTCSLTNGDARFTFSQAEFDPAEKPDLFPRLVVFEIERAMDGSFNESEVIWTNETYYYPAVAPWPVWLAGLVCDPRSEDVHLVMVYSITITEMVIDLYSVPGTATATSLRAPILTTETPQVPRLRVKSLANYVAELYYKGGGLRSLDATLTNGHIELFIAFRNEKIGPIHFEVDLETKEIRRVPEDPRAKGETPP